MLFPKKIKSKREKMNQMKLKRVILTLLVAGIILGSSNSFAAVASGSSATCSLGGKKCGKSVSKRYDVYSYAKSHYDATYSNQVGARLYGHHCDSQKTGCYGTATATNTN